jgi:hypothetical protein
MSFRCGWFHHRPLQKKFNFFCFWWSLLAVMSDWQRGVDWLLAEYCRCRLRLDLRWCRQARKVYDLWGLRAMERQVGSARGTWWPAGSSAGRMVARKARRSRGQEPVQGSGSRPEYSRGVCGGSPQNHRVTWLSHKTKTGGSAGGHGIRARQETSKRMTRVRITRLASRLS